MTLAAYLTAVFGLLLSPGPTNTLVGLAGAEGGFRRVLRLLPAELAGYMTAILPLALLGRGVLADQPMAAQAVKLTAGVWVMILAVRLWGHGALSLAGRHLSRARIYVTTVLNPKALIVSLVLLPDPAATSFVPGLALFLSAAAAVAMIWGGAGALTRPATAAEHPARILRRVASVWLAAVSVMLVAGAIHP